MKYNWQHPDWPNFSYDMSQCREALYSYAMEAGRLSGGVSQLKSELQYESYIDLMASEAINTSQIEGEKLNREDVRSSIKNYLGISVPPTRVTDLRAEGMAALMVDVRQTFLDGLTEEKLFQWHEMVIPNQVDSLVSEPVQVGKWRDSEKPMQIVSGPIGYENVHYEAPPSRQVAIEMDRFLTWYQNTNPVNTESANRIPGPIRAAIAHLWFESIHPFDDGNGRVGRAIAEQALAQDLGHPPLLSLSTTIEKERKEYYNRLHKASGPHMDVSKWVEWFCGAVQRAQQEAVQKVGFVLQKSKFWDAHKDTTLNDRQLKILRKVFNAGPEGFEFGLSSRKYMNITSCSKATATRDLTGLVEKGCLEKLEGGGRSVRYALSINRGQQWGGHD